MRTLGTVVRSVILAIIIVISVQDIAYAEIVSIQHTQTIFVNTQVIAKARKVRAEGLRKKKVKKPWIEHDKDDIDLLAHLIFAEIGSDWIPDEELYYVGGVVLNRVKSDSYPDTLEDVIYQKGQFSVVNSGAINKQPTKRCYKIAKDLLKNGPQKSCGIPKDVLYFAHFRQGSGTWHVYGKVKYCYK